ncbi:hypothetical protein FIBSPDRAFT_941193 [Athelia psychrophila]|uniref:Uncharacterized protein n=1 Tax=Athelia psychrophila TaxID=1759441 RepID=A0A167ULE6_9AGAM|nr:hypothetical protein FIBSPDRAFT_941193 [Fibularhizoctonia sp. CBS 109695]
MKLEVPASDDCDLTIVEHGSQTAHPSDSSPCSDNNSLSDVGLSRHSEFDLTESLVEFAVESTIFRVRSFFLDRESRGSYRFYTPGVNRVYLEGTTCLEFASLKFFYYGTRYEMTGIRPRAISEVYTHPHNIDPAQWIVISEKNNVVEWLLEARTALCSREASKPVLTKCDLVDDDFEREERAKERLKREKETLRQEQEREKERLEKEQKQKQKQERLKRETERLQHEQEQERLEQRAIRARDERESQKAEQENAEARAHAIERERKEKQMSIFERNREAERKTAEMARVGELDRLWGLDDPSGPPFPLPVKAQTDLKCTTEDHPAPKSLRLKGDAKTKTSTPPTSTCTEATATAPSKKRLSLKEEMAQAEAAHWEGEEDRQAFECYNTSITACR